MYFTGLQEVERLTLENSKLVEENQDLHHTVEALQSKAGELEASLEEKTSYLVRLADEVTARVESSKKNEQLLAEANQKVCICFSVSFAVCVIHVHVCVHFSDVSLCVSSLLFLSCCFTDQITGTA